VEDPFNKGVFLPAPFIKGSLVVNTGDFLQRWSNDQLKSTLHRVTAPPVDSETGISKARYSIPFFISANRDKVVDALEGTYSDDNPKKYEPITAGEYLNRRLNVTYMDS
jgi:isopenicillin N synthase-like dioxygenase